MKFGRNSEILLDIISTGYVMNVGRGYVTQNNQSGSDESWYRAARAAKTYCLAPAQKKIKVQ